MKKDIIILGIESSCDDTSAAIIKNGLLLSNITSSQAIHKAYGGVVPELASRAHQQNILPVVDQAIKKANIHIQDISAIAVTLGPGLMGSLHVGINFAKGLALSLGIPLIEVNHLQGHILAHFIQTPEEKIKTPPYPFLCLMVSGGNSQIVKVDSYNKMEILGQTIDDAAGEAMDKCSKIMGLGYPGGPIIDKLARKGNPNAFKFSKPNIKELNYSFSGLKTSFLYFLKDQLKTNPNFIKENLEDLSASLEKTIVDILMTKLESAAQQTNIKDVALSGGVSANTALRRAFMDREHILEWNIYIPKFSYTTDNAAMIAMVGYYKYQDKQFCPLDKPAFTRTIL